MLTSSKDSLISLNHLWFITVSKGILLLGIICSMALIKSLTSSLKKSGHSNFPNKIALCKSLSVFALKGTVPHAIQYNKTPKLHISDQ